MTHTFVSLHVLFKILRLIKSLSMYYKNFRFLLKQLQLLSTVLITQAMWYPIYWLVGKYLIFSGIACRSHYLVCLAMTILLLL